MIPDTEQLWRELRDRLRAFIARRVDNPADVNDLLQEVFLRIHQHLSTIKDSERLTAWIFQLTRNVITDFYRAAPHRREILRESFAEREAGGEAEEPAELLTSEEQAARQDELAPCLTPLIERLPEHYRDAIQQVEIEGLSQLALRERSNMSLSGAKSRVQRGREKLKDLLLQCCQVEFDKRGQVMDYRLEDTHAACGTPDAALTAREKKGTPGTCRCLQQKEGRHEQSIV